MWLLNTTSVRHPIYLNSIEGFWSLEGVLNPFKSSAMFFTVNGPVGFRGPVGTGVFGGDFFDGAGPGGNPLDMVAPGTKKPRKKKDKAARAAKAADRSVRNMVSISPPRATRLTASG